MQLTGKNTDSWKHPSKQKSQALYILQCLLALNYLKSIHFTALSLHVNAGHTSLLLFRLPKLPSQYYLNWLGNLSNPGSDKEV